VVMATCVVMTEFMGQKNREECEGKREAGQQRSGMPVGYPEHLEKGVEGGGLIVAVGRCEMRASDQRGEKCEEKKADGEKKRFSGGIGTLRGPCAFAWPSISPVLRRERYFCLSICLWRIHRGLFGLGDRGVFEALQFLAGLEADGFSRRDADFLTGARIAANAGLARLDAEDPEFAELDALTAPHGVLERFKDGFDGLFGLGTADVCLRYHTVYDIELDHAGLRHHVARC
jgi:hypothetical protein